MYVRPLPLLILLLLFCTSQIVRLLPPATVSEDEEGDNVETGHIEREGDEGGGMTLAEGFSEDQVREKEDSFGDESIMKSKSKGKAVGRDISRPRGNSIVQVDSDEEVRQLAFSVLSIGS